MSTVSKGDVSSKTTNSATKQEEHTVATLTPRIQGEGVVSDFAQNLKLPVGPCAWPKVFLHRLPKETLQRYLPIPTPTTGSKKRKMKKPRKLDPDTDPDVHRSKVIAMSSSESDSLISLISQDAHEKYREKTKSTSDTPKNKIAKSTSKTPKPTNETPKTSNKSPKAKSKTLETTNKTPKSDKTPRTTKSTPKTTNKTPKTSKTQQTKKLAKHEAKGEQEKALHRHGKIYHRISKIPDDSSDEEAPKRKSSKMESISAVTDESSDEEVRKEKDGRTPSEIKRERMSKAKVGICDSTTTDDNSGRKMKHKRKRNSDAEKGDSQVADGVREKAVHRPGKFSRILMMNDDSTDEDAPQSENVKSDSMLKGKSSLSGVKKVSKGNEDHKPKEIGSERVTNPKKRIPLCDSTTDDNRRKEITKKRKSSHNTEKEKADDNLDKRQQNIPSSYSKQSAGETRIKSKKDLEQVMEVGVNPNENLDSEVGRGSDGESSTHQTEQLQGKDTTDKERLKQHIRKVIKDQLREQIQGMAKDSGAGDEPDENATNQLATEFLSENQLLMSNLLTMISNERHNTEEQSQQSDGVSDDFETASKAGSNRQCESPIYDPDEEGSITFDDDEDQCSVEQDEPSVCSLEEDEPSMCSVEEDAPSIGPWVVVATYPIANASTSREDEGDGVSSSDSEVEDTKKEKDLDDDRPSLLTGLGDVLDRLKSSPDSYINPPTKGMELCLYDEEFAKKAKDRMELSRKMQRGRGGERGRGARGRGNERGRGARGRGSERGRGGIRGRGRGWKHEGIHLPFNKFGNPDVNSIELGEEDTDEGLIDTHGRGGGKWRGRGSRFQHGTRGRGRGRGWMHEGRRDNRYDMPDVDSEMPDGGTLHSVLEAKVKQALMSVLANNVDMDTFQQEVRRVTTEQVGGEDGGRWSEEREMERTSVWERLSVKGNKKRVYRMTVSQRDGPQIPEFGRSIMNQEIMEEEIDEDLIDARDCYYDRRRDERKSGKEWKGRGKDSNWEYDSRKSDERKAIGWRDETWSGDDEKYGRREKQKLAEDDRKHSRREPSEDDRKYSRRELSKDERKYTRREREPTEDFSKYPRREREPSEEFSKYPQREREPSEEIRKYPRREPSEEFRKYPRREPGEEFQKYPRREPSEEFKKYPRSEREPSEEIRKYSRRESSEEVRKYPRRDSYEEVRKYSRREPSEEYQKYPRRERESIEEVRKYPQRESSEDVRNYPRREPIEEVRKYPRRERESSEEVRKYPRTESNEEVRKYPRREPSEEVRHYPRRESIEEIRNYPRREPNEEVRKYPRGESSEEFRKYSQRETIEEVRNYPRREPSEEVRKYPRGESNEELRKYSRRETSEEVRKYPRGESNEEYRKYPRGEPSEDYRKYDRRETSEYPRRERDEREMGRKDDRRSRDDWGEDKRGKRLKEK